LVRNEEASVSSAALVRRRTIFDGSRPSRRKRRAVCAIWLATHGLVK
jgi:hypothetical protein